MNILKNKKGQHTRKVIHIEIKVGEEHDFENRQEWLKQGRTVKKLGEDRDMITPTDINIKAVLGHGEGRWGVFT